MPTILIVDDEPSILTVTERMARFHGFMPVGTSTVDQALAAAQQHTNR